MGIIDIVVAGNDKHADARAAELAEKMVDEILVGDALTILGQVARDEQHLGMLGQEAVGDAVHDLHTLAQQFAVGRKIVLESLAVRLEQFGCHQMDIGDDAHFPFGIALRPAHQTKHGKQE